MPIPSQDLTRALAGDAASAASLGRYLDSLQIIGGPATAQLARGSGSAVLTTVQVIAGDGLTGGGALTSDVTLNVGAGDGVTVTANAVAVDATVVRTTRTLEAGAGLTGGGTLASDRSFAVGAGTGITVNANDVAIDQAFTPTWTGAHIWSTTATFNGDAVFTSLASSLLPKTTDTYDLGSSTKLWRKGWLSELDAVLFAQNVVTVIGGWLLISKGEGVLGTDLGDGAGDTTADLGTTAGIAAHATTGDIILFRGLGQVEYMKVTAGTGPTWTVTRDLDGTGRNAWPAGSVFVNLGYGGTGRIELNANSTPRISIIRQGTTYNAQTEMVRIGDLNGWGGFVAEEYGWAVGDYAGGNYAYYGTATGFLVSAGDGKVTLDANGLAITASDNSTPGNNNVIRFLRPGTPTAASQISAIYDTTVSNLVALTLENANAPGTGMAGSVTVSAVSASGQEASAQLKAYVTGASGSPRGVYVSALANTINLLATTVTATATTFNVTGGQNVGTATGAGTGQVYTKGTSADNWYQVADGNPAGIILETYRSSTSQSRITTRSARGSLASPTASAAEDILFYIASQGYQTTSSPGFTAHSPWIRVYANQTFTNTAQGTRIQFHTVTNGATDVSLAVTIGNDKSLLVAGGIAGGVATVPTGGDLSVKRSGGNAFNVQTPSSETRVYTDAAQLWLGANGTADLVRIGSTGALLIPDGITAPSATTGKATLYVDTADGDLKVKFADGTTKTIVVDT